MKSEAGEDVVVICSCGYAANLQRAVSQITEVSDEEGDLSPQEIHTPGQKNDSGSVGLFKNPNHPPDQVTGLHCRGSTPSVLLRGDHQLSEAQLESAVGTGVFRPATAEEIRETFGADPGSLGPVGLTQVPILADQALEGRRNMVCGANKDDYHLKNVTPDKDFSPTYHSLREVESGDRCVSCQQPLEVAKTLEIGHIFKLGYKYSESMGATVLTDEGKKVPMIMGVMESAWSESWWLQWNSITMMRVLSGPEASLLFRPS